MDNSYFIYAALTLAGAALRHYFPQLGRWIPGGPPLPGPVPLPAPLPIPAQPQTDRPLADCLAWCSAAKAGMVPMDEMDLRALRSLKPLVDELSAEKPK